MTTAKRRAVITISGLILFIAGTFVAADWIVYYFCDIKKLEGTCSFSMYQNITKFCTTCLNALLAWIIVNDGIDRRDTILLSLAFAFTVLADFFLKILYNTDPSGRDNYLLAGIITFMIVQTFYIIRHSRNMKGYFIYDSGIIKKNVFTEALWFILIAAAVSVIIYLRPKPLTATVLIYAAFLITSLATAWGTIRRSFYPRKNAWMIAIGLTCFFCCDVNVGISILPDTPIANNVIWMFYTPALMLLSLSGYRWEE